MRIKVKDLSDNGEVWVKGIYGPKHLEAQGKECLALLNEILTTMKGEA